MSFKSQIYTGMLHHRRTSPKVHDFRYQVAMFYLDISEIEKIFKVPFLFSFRGPSLAGFRRGDYLKGDESLSQAVKDLILAKTGRLHDGPIRLLTQIRYFGFCFNPVSFYYCFDASEKLKFVVAEITNTPWNERHSYVLEMNPLVECSHFEFQKDFHVSPFFPMELQYRWSLNSPNPVGAMATLRVDMEDWDLKSKECVFEAHLSLKAKEMNSKNLILLVLGFPFLTFKTFFAIYFQALLLLMKRVPFYSHPKSGETR